MQLGYVQIGAWSTATRGGGLAAKHDCLYGIHDEKPTLEAERPTWNSKGRKALPTPATSTGENGECDGMTACFAMS